MRKTWDSSKTRCTAALSARAEARSVPKGFSMMTRESGEARPAWPSVATTDSKADGGTARWNRRWQGVPISLSAWATAVTSGAGSPGSAAAKESRRANSSHISPVGFFTPNWAMSSWAWLRKSSSDRAKRTGDVPMIR